MKFLGLDTETVKGFAKLICLSDGGVYKINNLECIFRFFTSYKETYFFAYNADYDIQAILKYFSPKTIDRLIKGIFILYHGVSFQYVKNKYLKFNDNYIFDCYQYYQVPLAVASRNYLGEKKGEIDRAKITLKNVFSSSVIKYCIKDADLALKLFLFFYEGLPEEVKNVKPISTAFYSFKYFKKELKENKVISNINLLFRQAYFGGRFEVFEKGYFKKVYVYDINSAYPYEIAKLRGLKNCSVVRLKEYVREASYSFYHIKVDIKNKLLSPLVHRSKGLCIFPVGSFEGYVTKGEYESVREWDPEIISAFHIFGNRDFPFRDKITALYGLKAKSRNPLPYKIILNSLYGKTAQSIRKYFKYCGGEVLNIYQDEGDLFFEYEDISGSNFVYASEITSRVRLRMYGVLRDNYEKVIAIQTDSLLSKEKLDLEISQKLGGWKCEEWRDVYVLGSGVYFYKKGKEICSKFRGFNFSGEKVQKILNQILVSDRPSVEFKTLKRFSIQEARRLHDDEVMNQILEVSRKLDINFDKKRVWLKSWKSGKEIREKRIKSLALYLYEKAGQNTLF